jgi:hypothetical protein
MKQTNWSFHNETEDGNVIVSVCSEWTNGLQSFYFTAGTHTWKASPAGFCEWVDTLVKFRDENTAKEM